MIDEPRLKALQHVIWRDIAQPAIDVYTPVPDTDANEARVAVDAVVRAMATERGFSARMSQLAEIAMGWLRPSAENA